MSRVEFQRWPRPPLRSPTSSVSVSADIRRSHSSVLPSDELTLQPSQIPIFPISSTVTSSAGRSARSNVSTCPIRSRFTAINPPRLSSRVSSSVSNQCRVDVGAALRSHRVRGQVRKGEKATPVLFYKYDDERKAQQPPDTDKTGKTPDGAHECEHTRPPMVRCYHVFNVKQADGLTFERRADEQQPEWQSHQAAELAIRESGVAVTHERGDRAFYNLQD